MEYRFKMFVIYVVMFGVILIISPSKVLAYFMSLTMSLEA